MGTASRRTSHPCLRSWSRTWWTQQLVSSNTAWQCAIHNGARSWTQQVMLSVLGPSQVHCQPLVPTLHSECVRPRWQRKQFTRNREKSVRLTTCDVRRAALKDRCRTSHVAPRTSHRLTKIRRGPLSEMLLARCVSCQRAAMVAAHRRARCRRFTMQPSGRRLPRSQPGHVQSSSDDQMVYPVVSYSRLRLSAPIDELSRTGPT
jgi:hypothetical protein